MKRTFIRNCLIIFIFAFLVSTTGCVSVSIVASTRVLERNVAHGNNLVSKESYIENAGQPDAFGEYKNCEVLTYYDGFTWSKVWGMFLVIPYIVGYPSGREEDRVYIRGRYAVGLTEEHVTEKFSAGFACLIGLGCSSIEFDDKEVKLNKDDWCR